MSGLSTNSKNTNKMKHNFVDVFVLEAGETKSPPSGAPFHAANLSKLE
jgi:hypothetical protein